MSNKWTLRAKLRGLPTVSSDTDVDDNDWLHAGLASQAHLAAHDYHLSKIGALAKVKLLALLETCILFLDAYAMAEGLSGAA